MFTKERAEAAKKRLVERFLNRSAAPPAPFEEDAIISDVADYMGYLFEAGYRDFDSNSRKLVQDVGAAISQHLDHIRLKRENEIERRLAAMAETISVGSGRPN